MYLSRTMFVSWFWLLGLVHSQGFALRAQQALQQGLELQPEHEPDVRPYFMSPEHTAIGNRLKLTYDDKIINGSDLDYIVNGIRLSFGEIIALSGDYFYDFSYSNCVTSISEDWDASPGSTDRAKINVGHLRTDWKGYLKCTLKHIGEQGDEIRKAWNGGTGEDPTQAYLKTYQKYNKIFGACTIGGYAIIPLWNPDHYGKDAEKAYSSVHTLAIKTAVSARGQMKAGDQRTGLREAYFIEAYGQHFLTDAFSAGHVRTPRRKLHSATRCLPLTDNKNGDFCALDQHDEDCVSGLWVTNREGQSWTVYGDKQVLHGRSAKNLQVAHEASQAGVDEVWEAFKSGNVPRPSDYAALKKTPVLEMALGLTNFVPLFEQSATNENVLLFRDKIDQRSSDARRTIDTEQPKVDWKGVRQDIREAGSFKQMYPYTRSFTSDQKILHLGTFDSAVKKSALSLYRSVDAGDYGRYWGMAGQTITNIIATSSKATWTDAQALGGGVVSLTGRSEGAALHLGFNVQEESKGQMTIKVLWNHTAKDETKDLTTGTALYGRFDADTDDTALIQYYQDQKSEAKVVVWLLPSGKRKDVVKIGSGEISRLNFLISHQIEKSDSFTTAVGYGVGSDSKGIWSFIHWHNEWKKPVFKEITVPNSKRAQALLSDPASGRLIQLFYGRSSSDPQSLQLQILKPSRNKETGDITFDDSHITTQNFPVQWRSSDEADYLLWFVHDVDGDGHNDLVAYTSSANNELLDVIVLPGNADGSYANPIVSSITLDPKRGTFLTGGFMKPLATVQSSYSYSYSYSAGGSGSGGSKTSEAAIMSFFDNYGVVGMRVVAPLKPGSFQYELKGQEPAVAGQRATTLGWRDGGWMGLARKGSAVGILAL